MRAFTDLRSVPTWVHDAADTLLKLLSESVPGGVYHANNSGDTTWYEFACEALERAQVSGAVEPTRIVDIDLPARRPSYSVLDVTATERVVGTTRDWKDALAAAIEVGLWYDFR